jgi:hypothetical protein
MLRKPTPNSSAHPRRLRDTVNETYQIVQEIGTESLTA